MGLSDVDVIVRICGVAALALLATLLIRDDAGGRLARWFAPLALCICGFLIGNTADLSLRLHGAVATFAHLVSGYAVVFIWWFCLVCFDPAFRPQGAVLAVGVAWLVIASADRGLLGPWAADRGLSHVLTAVGFGVIAHLAWRLVGDRRGDFLEARRKARVMVVVMLAGILTVELCKEVVFGDAWRPAAYTIAENAAILAVTLWLIAHLLHADTSLWTARPSAANTAKAPEGIGDGRAPAIDERLRARLRDLIEVERAHLDPDLTFDVFVGRMGAPERTVRQLINRQLGYDHFRSFLNAHRMVEARRLLGDPTRAEDKLISIALDSGFASIASFNRIFRAAQGCTPSEYRTACAKGEPPNPELRVETSF